mgnify:CR=1 FL=1
MGKEFKGVYNLHNHSLNLFTPGQKSTEENSIPIADINDTILDEKVGDRDARTLREDVELLSGVYGALPIPSYLGEMKSKPVQQSVRMLNSMGIEPDIIVGRIKIKSFEIITKSKSKHFLFTRVQIPVR